MIFQKALFIFAAMVSTTWAFAPSSKTASITQLNAYVPAGLSPEEYKKIREQDKKRVGKDLGRLGPRGFKSRSMQAWQEAYEQGKAGHAFAPFGYREQLKEGKIKKEDVPYMVRQGGHWDNRDIFGAKRLRWLRSDKEYAKGGYKKEQSASLLGSGPGLNWSGERRAEDKKRSYPGFF